jgi:hypothetical protein
MQLRQRQCFAQGMRGNVTNLDIELYYWKKIADQMSKIIWLPLMATPGSLPVPPNNF